MVLEHLSADELVRMGATCRRLWMLISRDTPDEQASNSSSDSSSKLAGGGRRGCGSGSAIHGASVGGENKCDETIGDSPCANNRAENPTSGISSASGRARKRKRAEAAISGLRNRAIDHKHI